jgi:hypothetical protein
LEGAAYGSIPFRFYIGWESAETLKIEVL